MESFEKICVPTSFEAASEVGTVGTLALCGPQQLARHLAAQIDPPAEGRSGPPLLIEAADAQTRHCWANRDERTQRGPNPPSLAGVVSAVGLRM